ncbi:MAG: hypothetical protein IPO88_10300 [Nannocystis sp.]|uniref:hypothetical protein n=1 Tax=Nannocystis sp. TaxID=1962667 RepID=UPI002427BD9D|nr:hypothetical protein [Nannocystis sp.]MBK9753877.1 hypothetical protein [Nannocystis sp.]
MRRSPPRRPGSISAQTRLASLASLALTLLLGAACTGARANSHYRYPRDVAYGTPSTCPNVRMPPLRDGNVSTDAARCSYADANGARVTHLAGKVLAEGGPGDPGTGVNSVAVTVHSVAGPVFDPAAPGPVIAHATTDAQGNYSLRGVFVAGDYAVVVREPTGERIADRIVRVEPEAIGSLKNLHVTVPLDPRLKAAAVPPPTPPLDPRLHHTGAPATGTPGQPPRPLTPHKPPSEAGKPPADPLLRMRPPTTATPTPPATPP